MTDRGLTRKQTAEMTGYAEKTLANLSMLGQGPPMRKYRGHCIYLESEVLAWLRSLPVAGGARPVRADQTCSIRVNGQLMGEKKSHREFIPTITGQ